MRLTLAPLFMTAILAACGSGSVPTQVPLTRPLTTPAIIATDGARAGLVAEGSLSDKRGDLDNGDRGVAPPNPQIDLVEVTARADGKVLRLLLVFAGWVPEKMSSLEHQIAYAIDIEADRSRNVDYSVLVGNVESGEWFASLSDMATEGPGNDFPGVLVVSGDEVVALTIPLEALGNPRTLRLSVVAQRVDHADATVLAEDRAPNNAGSMRPTSKWLTLGK